MFVHLGMRNQEFNKGLADSSARLKKWSSSITSTGQKLTVGVTLPVIGMGVASVKAASDLNESMSAVNTVFGDTANTVMGMGGSVAENLGLSRQEALSAASMMGALYKSVGLTSNQMADFANQSLQAAADLGSFYNVPVPEALAAIRSGLTGEYEPLKRFGIILNEDKIKAYAMAHGLADANGVISDQAKLMARQAIIMEGLGAAQGDFVRTSGGLANQLRIVRAQIYDTAAVWGQILLPYVLIGVKYLSKLALRFQRMDKRWQKWIVLGALAAAALGPLLIILGQIAGGIAALAPVLGFLISPVGLIIAAVALLAIGLFLLYKRSETFRDAVNRLGGLIVQATKWFWGFLKPLLLFGKMLIGAVTRGKNLHEVLMKLPKPLQKITILARRIVVLFSDILHGRWNRVRGDLEKIGKTLGNLFKSLGLKNFGQEFKVAFDKVIALFSHVITLFGDLIHGRWGKLWGDFAQIVKDLLGLAVEYFKLSLSLWRDILGGLVSLFQAIPWGTIGAMLWAGAQLAFELLLKGAQAGWKFIWNWLHERGPGIVKAISTAMPLIFAVGRDIIGWLWSGLKSLADWLAIQIHEIPNLMLQALALFSPWFFNAGRDIISALWTGVASLGGWLFNQVWNFVKSNVKGALEGALGIGSPSKVFLQAGENSGTSYAMGLASKAGLIQKTIQNAINARKVSGMAAPAWMKSTAGQNYIASLIRTHGDTRNDFLAQMSGAAADQALAWAQANKGMFETGAWKNVFSSSGAILTSNGQATGSSQSFTVAKGAIQVSGVSDPEAAADQALDRLWQAIGRQQYGEAPA